MQKSLIVLPNLLAGTRMEKRAGGGGGALRKGGGLDLQPGDLVKHTATGQVGTVQRVQGLQAVISTENGSLMVLPLLELEIV